MTYRLRSTGWWGSFPVITDRLLLAVVVTTAVIETRLAIDLKVHLSKAPGGSAVLTPLSPYSYP